jgi:GNAT superfamily N-acetyltransferase
MSVTTVNVRIADLDDPRDAQAVLEMTREYAMDPMARSCDLPEEVKERLVGEMRAHPALFCFVAWDGDSPVGIATCLLSFSTFRARRLVNIHDICVAPRARGTGVARALLQAVESYAKSQGCGGITLEVYARNHHARDVYEAMGFVGSRAEEGSATYFCFKELA